jgi:uncharacterized membrane protein
MRYENSLISTVRRRIVRAASQPLIDLVLIAVVSGLVAVFVALDIEPVTGLRPMLVLVVTLFFPGYVLVSLLFPENDRRKRNRFQPDSVQRAALSFGTSVVLLPLFGLVPAVLGLPYEPMTALVVVESALGAGIVATAYRRMNVSEPDRYRIPLEAWLHGTYIWIRGAGWRRRVTHTLVVASVLLAAVSFSYVLAVPQNSETYTTMTLLTENESGALVAGGYPTALTAGEESNLTLTVENNRKTKTTYSVVVRLEQTTAADRVTRQGVRAQQIAVLQPTVVSNETWTRRHTITPTVVGEDIRLRYYLYIGSPPENVGPQTAHDYLHIWIDVESPDSG